MIGIDRGVSPTARFSAVVAVTLAIFAVASDAEAATSAKAHSAEARAADAAQAVAVVAGRTPRGHAFRLLAYDRRTRLCTSLLAPGLLLRSTACSASVPRREPLSFQSLQSFSANETLFGGAAAARVSTVELTLLDGRVVSVTTLGGRRYDGRFEGRVEFWATALSGLAGLAVLKAKDSRGAVVRTIEVAPIPPPPPPPPDPPPPPCFDCCCVVVQSTEPDRPCPLIYPPPPCPYSTG